MGKKRNRIRCRRRHQHRRRAIVSTVLFHFFFLFSSVKRLAVVYVCTLTIDLFSLDSGFFFNLNCHQLSEYAIVLELQLASFVHLSFVQYVVCRQSRFIIAQRSHFYYEWEKEIKGKKKKIICHMKSKQNVHTNQWLCCLRTRLIDVRAREYRLSILTTLLLPHTFKPIPISTVFNQERKRERDTANLERVAMHIWWFAQMKTWHSIDDSCHSI